MTMAVTTIAITLIVLVVGFGAVVALQFVLSNLDNKAWGLILPAVLFLASIVFSLPNFIESFRISFSPGAFLASVLLLLLYNIPTVVLLLIYAWRRRRKNVAAQLNKMSVQDL